MNWILLRNCEGFHALRDLVRRGLREGHDAVVAGPPGNLALLRELPRGGRQQLAVGLEPGPFFVVNSWLWGVTPKVINVITPVLLCEPLAQS